MNSHPSFVDLLALESSKLHPTVKDLLDGQSSYHRDLRSRLNEMWQNFRRAKLNDREFIIEFRSNPIARYWEMLLGCILLNRGHTIEHPPSGPDFKLSTPLGNVYIEATSVTSGLPGRKHSVPEVADNEASFFPVIAVELRVTNAISSKIKSAQLSDLEVDAPIVIALNTFDCGAHVMGSDVAKALFGIGNLISLPHVVIPAPVARGSARADRGRAPGHAGVKMG